MKKPGTVQGAPLPPKTRKFLQAGVRISEKSPTLPRSSVVESHKTPTVSLAKPRTDGGIVAAAKGIAKSFSRAVKRMLGSYTPNNATIYDAAYAGFLAGVNQGKDVGFAPNASDTAIIAEAIEFAQAVDSQIETGSYSTGQATFVGNLTQSIMSNKYAVGLPQSSYSSVASFVANLFTNAAGNFQESNTPVDSGPVQTDGGTPLAIDLNTEGAVTAEDADGSIVLAYSIAGASPGGVYQTFLGGEDNQMGAGVTNSVLIGGQNNQQNGNFSALVGGSGSAVGGDSSGCLAGDGHSVNGFNSACIGGQGVTILDDYGTALCCENSTIDAPNAVGIGSNCSAVHDFAIHTCSGTLTGSPGDAQGILNYIMRGETAGIAEGETASLLCGDPLSLEAKSYMFTVVATANDGAGNIAGWNFSFIAHCDGSIAVIDGLPDGYTGLPQLASGEEASTWTLLPTVDGTDTILTMEFTDGVSTGVIPCCAQVSWAEVLF